jgi:hypothetical protein
MRSCDERRDAKRLGEAVDGVLDLRHGAAVHHGEEIVGPAASKGCRDLSLVAMADGARVGEPAAGFDDVSGIDLPDEHDIGGEAELVMVEHACDAADHAGLDQLGQQREHLGFGHRRRTRRIEWPAGHIETVSEVRQQQLVLVAQRDRLRLRHALDIAQQHILVALGVETHVQLEDTRHGKAVKLDVEAGL